MSSRTGTLWLCAVLAGLFVGYLALYLTATLQGQGPYRFGDFFALWSYPQFIRSHGVAELYDAPALKAAQVAMGMAAKENNPFPYPPFFMLALWPLQPLSYGAAYVVWIGTTLLLYAAANWQRDLPVLNLAALIVPTTTINLIAGQSGFLSAALLVGGLRLLERQPVLAGVLFGLLTYKPQFGLMLPVALVALRQWRCAAAAAATTVLLAGAATVLFGADIWDAWLHALPAYAAWFDSLTVRHFMPTVTANLRSLGAPESIVQPVQAVFSLAAAVLVWIACRHFPRPLAIVAVLAATCLATPHAFIYDLPMLSSAVLLFVADRTRTGDGFRRSEIAVLILVLVFPALMAFGLRGPISTIALVLFAVLIATAPGFEKGSAAWHRPLSTP